MSKTSAGPTEDFIMAYRELRPTLDTLSRHFDEQVGHILDSAGVKPVTYNSRVKELESLLPKRDRFKSPRKVQDLVGGRLIVLFEQEAIMAEKAIRREFDVIRRYNTSERLGDREFGYGSIHLVLEPRRSWRELPSLSSCGGVQIELQVRTLAQHLWAEASHRLSYKDPDGVPPALRRSLGRIAALVEFVDEEFERLLRAREDYQEQISGVDSDDPLNVELVAATLEKLWPEKNKLDDEPYAFLQQQLEESGIGTQRQLAELIRRHKRSVLFRVDEEVDRMRALVNAEDEYDDLSGKVRARLRAGTYYGHVALTLSALAEED